MIYLASPYTHPDPAVREARFEAACRAVIHLVRQGETVFSPVVHSHPLALRGLRGDWHFWEATDRAFLACAQELRILKLDGWEKSVGVTAERQIAADLGLPVSCMEPVDGQT